MSSQTVLRLLAAALLTSALLVPPPAGAEQGAPITFEALVKDYIQHNRDMFAGSRDLSLAYANRFLCDDYQKNARNEFTLPKVIAKAQEEIKALNVPETPLVVRDYTTFGTYDATAGKFAFNPMTQRRNIITITDDMIGGIGRLSPCAPTVPGWPKHFRIEVENYDLIDGIPMPADKAQSLVESRQSLPEIDQRKLGVNYTLVFKDWEKVDDKYTGKVKASVVAVTLDDGTVPPGWGKAVPPKILYTYDAAYIAARQAEVDKRLNSEHVKKTTGPIAYEPQNLKLWYDVFTEKKPRTMPDGTELRAMMAPVAFSVHGTQGISMDIFKKGAELNGYLTGFGMLHMVIVNNDEFGDVIALTPEVTQKVMDNLANARGFVLVTPVGATPRTDTGSAKLYAHADKLLIQIYKDGKVVDTVEMAAKSQPTPYTPPAEPAPAAAPATH